MTRNVHDDARGLIALGEAVTDAQQSWLRSHLEECASCRNYSEAAQRTVAALRSMPLAADSRLVRATQMRVRFHASRLRETRERFWLLGTACFAVGLSATLTAPLLWRLFAWLGAWAGVPNGVWQAGFACFWIAPALVVSVLLLARGIHLRDDRERSQESR
jgi:predicted anti-sigma-YlaC factor YlaD